MQFNQKLQQLRKEKGLTQQELAQQLFVSRTAVSKWESGRGYPNIDSLKALAEFFSVTVDELLSGDQVLDIAQKESKEKEKLTGSLLFGILDLCASMLFFLPLFAERGQGTARAVSLLELNEIAVYMKVSYFAVALAIILLGAVTLAVRNSERLDIKSVGSKISLVLNLAAVMLFTLSLQPYASAFMLIFLVIRVFMMLTRKVSLM